MSAYRKPFIMFLRNHPMEAFWDLIHERTSYILLSVIAQRASVNGNPIRGVKPGEAQIGDYVTYGMTEQEYRTAKDKLVEWEFITIRTTNKGTIAKILPNDVFDVNATGQQRTGNALATTIKKGNKGKNVKKYKEDSEEINLSLMFSSSLKENFPGMREPDLQSWADDFRKMIQLDKLPHAAIVRMINWVTRDIHEPKANSSWRGWGPVVKSPKKLREKWDDLCAARGTEEKIVEEASGCRPRTMEELEAMGL